MLKTLAARLGTTTHVSALLYKARKLGLRTPDDFSALAAQRGCRHYWHEGMPEGELATHEQFSDEELVMALLNVALLTITPPVKEGALPHPTRFIAMSGFIPGVGRKLTTEGQRPQRKKIAA